MKFISAQPDSDYFIWQSRVQMNNFKKFNLEKDSIVLFGFDSKIGINSNAVKFSKNTDATVIFIPDNRDNVSRQYIPTIRPHIIKQFLRDYDLVNGHDIMYHDSDIIFASLPNFDLLGCDERFSVSDTISYLGSKYVKSKGDGLLEEMCGIVGIDPKIVESNENNTGGAQYYFPKNIKMSYELWNKIENDCHQLYSLMISTSNKYTPTHPIQAWTSDMWAVLWNFWLLGHGSVISKELEFSWPTFLAEDWDRYHIFHNAGVTPDRIDLFFKGGFVNISPFNSTHENVDNRFCSIKYVQEIIETGKLLN